MRQCESEHQPLYVDQEWDKTGGIVGFDLDCPRQGEAKTLHYEWGHHKSRATEVEAVSELLSHSNLMNVLFTQCDCGVCFLSTGSKP